MSSIEHPNNKEEIMKSFHESILERGEKHITLEDLRELKEQGITTEQFLNHVSAKCNYLFHGSQENIDVLKSHQGKVFASDTAAIAIMRSVYSNKGAELIYPYIVDDAHPLAIKIKVAEDSDYISSDKGFVYCVDKNGFKNEPEGSWQYIKEDEDSDIMLSVETEKEDFGYPVEVIKEEL